MSTHHFRLAALATAAVPELRAVAAAPASAQPDCFTADVLDDQDRTWRVRAPRDDEAAKRLDHEVAVWEALNATNRLPFKVPTPHGIADSDDDAHAVVYPRPEGRTINVARLAADSSLLPGLVSALAALHKVPASALDHVDVPRFSAEEYRLRRLAELQTATETGFVPAELVTRWTNALAAGDRWDFAPTVVHGDLVADHVLTHDKGVNYIVEWSETKIADPADDLAWILATATDEVAERALRLYRTERTGCDDHLMWRAKLAGELSVARWMLYGITISDRTIVASARKLMRELARDVAAGRLPS